MLARLRLGAVVAASFGAGVACSQVDQPTAAAAAGSLLQWRWASSATQQNADAGDGDAGDGDAVRSGAGRSMRFGLPQVYAGEAPKQGLPPLQVMRYGFPDMGSIKYREGYIMSYDRRNKTANWVCEHLNAERLAVQEAKRDGMAFKEDDTDPELFRARLADYRGSGYDRGHMAPAGNYKWSTKAMEDTFYLSNMSMQVGKGFNRDKWEELESYVRSLTKTNRNVYVCTGPLYLPRQEADGNMYVRYKVVGPSQVAVPTHFFKVAVVEAPNGNLTIQSWVLPNEVIPNDTPLTSFKRPLAEIERRAGFLLYNSIPDKYTRGV
ncbi:nuclease [Capsaspora owczarzaki ATCC 30864]|uniref:Endonuclease n=1 Tax=Capsaspora owczarzaki (strain ATCC 30864) TaxID=595528 RepID=A0A0D2WKR2_CAPO3|nr:nuclease [Capsaspora owczarzaki ATCC 30864]KJE90253.1 nuclease [Capsaspora owczarzaki ATCC 30864]|eukprot:XP_004364458.1 nuclease [Capsaspora owczarzaki ATCC 30864]